MACGQCNETLRLVHAMCACMHVRGLRNVLHYNSIIFATKDHLYIIIIENIINLCNCL